MNLIGNQLSHVSRLIHLQKTGSAGRGRKAGFLKRPDDSRDYVEINARSARRDGGWDVADEMFKKIFGERLYVFVLHLVSMELLGGCGDTKLPQVETLFPSSKEQQQ